MIATYVWLVTSGNDALVYSQGKFVYKAVCDWFEDAEVDFQLKVQNPKKRVRRWD